ncbi:MAG: STAS domain-containing protein [Merismopedia sp. SIO2A8]|nr:STAS domain-containing protein [Symploca sp. SIO2B6]NET47628.1 STAS domain-containing protein [Merismopedia sp. SIO2A8]
MFDVKVYQPGNRILSAMDSVTLATWVSESLEAGAKYLAIDLKLVSFLDSRGLGALVLVHNRVEKIGGILALCGVSGQLEMLLELTNMKSRFNIYQSVPAFKGAIAEEPPTSSTPLSAPVPSH